MELVVRVSSAGLGAQGTYRHLHGRAVSDMYVKWGRPTGSDKTYRCGAVRGAPIAAAAFVEAAPDIAARIAANPGVG